VIYCRPPADEKVADVNDSTVGVSDSMMSSGDITMDSIKEHTEYVLKMFMNISDSSRVTMLRS